MRRSRRTFSKQRLCDFFGQITKTNRLYGEFELKEERVRRRCVPAESPIRIFFPLKRLY
jgi:hypothetical protein